MLPEGIEQLNNKFSHVGNKKRIKDLEDDVRARDIQIRNLCIEVSGKRMNEINATDKKHRNEVIFDLIACLLIFAILIALTYVGSVLWAALVISSFYVGYLTARKRHSL